MSYGLTGKEIKRRVARYLGYDSENLNKIQEDDLRDALDDGYRRFLDPSRTDGIPAHKWTFIRGEGSLTFALEDGSSTDYKWVYDSPQDFGTMDSPFAYTTGHVFHHDIYQTDVPSINRYRATDLTVPYQYPSWFAIRWSHTNDAGGEAGGKTKAQFIFYPTPQDALTVNYQYTKFKDKLGDSDSEPLGGDVHSQTVLAACMAAAELNLEETRGHWWSEFQDRMRTSIDYDRRNNPVYFGYNGDPGITEQQPKARRLISWTHANLP